MSRYTSQIHFVVSIANSMVTMRINVKTSLYVPNVANLLYIMQVCVKTQRSVLNVEKATMLIQKNAKFGKRKKKYFELNLHVPSLFLQREKQLSHQLLLRGLVMLILLSQP